MKVLAMESSNAESHFQQLDNLRMVYEEYVKIGKETIPLAEKTLHKLTEELDQKSQAHYDVCICSVDMTLVMWVMLWFIVKDKKRKITFCGITSLMVLYHILCLASILWKGEVVLCMWLMLMWLMGFPLSFCCLHVACKNMFQAGNRKQKNSLETNCPF